MTKTILHSLLALSASFALTACGTRTCKHGTVLLTIDYGGLPDGVSIALALSKDGQSLTQSLTREGSAPTGTVEVDFASGYPEGGTLTIDATATSQNTIVGHDHLEVSLTGSCAAAKVSFGGVDAGALDGSAVGTDASTATDLAGLVFPSNVLSTYLSASKTDWTVTADTQIDTSQTTLETAVTPAAPSGVLYAIDGNNAIIAVHNLTVTAGSTLTVVGAQALVIVADGTIEIDGVIDASGHGTVPGPYGSTAGAGAGTQGTFVSNTMIGSGGGGGGGFGSGGASGGSSGSGIGASGGGTYGSDDVQPKGGSGGGLGGILNGQSKGGAGGGFLQLSARVSIVVADFNQLGNTTASGLVAVAGGGGGGGTVQSAGGGGGGSGGKLLLEAPVVDIGKGELCAAGGGGGSEVGPGHDGVVLTAMTTSSLGGASGATPSNAGGAGANQITAGAGPVAGGDGQLNNGGDPPHGGGGGGGGAGRIRIRSSGPASFDATKVTPTPTLDPSLPSKIP